MKLLFLSPNELSQVLNKIMETNKGVPACCEVGFSEELNTDIASITQNKTTEEIPIQHLIPQLNEAYNVQIQSYDVYEVGDFGEGFAFSIT